MTEASPTGGQRRLMLADHVYDELLTALIDGRYSGGSPLSIDGLARELEVSQTPIREALARLESTGLVRRTALKGYRVAPLFTTEELAELTDARLVIEPVNAYLACQRVDDELVARLQDSIDDLAASPTGPSFAEFRGYWEADERFHRLIAEHAHNQFLLSAYRALGGQVQRFRLFVGLGVTDAEHAIAEHTAILEAFARGDADEAREAMRRHIGGVKRRSLNESVERETS
ncbi:GntR family transcriptional regulator [Marisediminicola sp. LYQ134]|uniref:GntR family transcriptional regulator n=1 Tax=unclassified Marisediminicola TaxID=2618316 RepID=UPI0039834B5C